MRFSEKSVSDRGISKMGMAPLGGIVESNEARQGGPDWVGIRNRGLTFGAALEALKHGRRVARAGWNGKGMWLARQAPGTYAAQSELFDNVPVVRRYAELETASTSVDVAATIVMRAADGSFVFGWLASQTDMDASDWVEFLAPCCALDHDMDGACPVHPPR